MVCVDRPKHEVLPDYKMNVIVFDGFMTDCFEGFINTAGRPLENDQLFAEDSSRAGTKKFSV
jgi:hypothetical protein